MLLIVVVEQIDLFKEMTYHRKILSDLQDGSLGLLEANPHIHVFQSRIVLR